jgi:outer membrane receptor protein involved in Fe transport
MLLVSTHLYSQSYTGRILGSVTDETGAVIPGATVSVTDVQRGVTRTLTTDTAGEYLAPELLPGVYNVRAEAKGFASVEHSQIELQVAQDVTINFALKLGTISQTIVVSGVPAALNTTNATLGGTLSNATINALPLNGRNFENLITLRPGVVIYPGGGFQTQSANGLRPEDVGYLLDGLRNHEPFQGQSLVNQAGFAGDASTILPIDAIQQFNVMENPPAQFGWSPGAIVNVALKSGTNQVHGTAYAFGRDDAFDARNFFNPGGTPKTPLDLEQYGGTVGGPILKNKLFFFAGYEGQRYSVGNPFVTTIPVAVSLAPSNPVTLNCAFIPSGDCANSIPDAIADLQAGGFAMSPVSQKLITLFPTNPGPSPLVPLGFPNSITANNGVAKLDFRLNDRNQLTYDYFIGDQSGTAETRAVVQPEFLSRLGERAQAHGLHWLWNPNPRWVNDAKLGYDRFAQGPLTTTLDSGIPATAFGISTGVTNPLLGGLPNIFVGGFTALGGDFILPKVLGTDHIYELDDTVSYLLGRHAFSFGGDVEHWIVTAGRFANGRGKIKFGPGVITPGAPFGSATALEDFLAGAPFLGIIQLGNALRRVNQWAYALFLQDDWRTTSRLTVNLGLRYEYTTPMRAAHGLLGNFDPNIGLIQQGLGGVDTVYHGDPTNVSPRLGFAWNPGGGKTVIRGGASMIYSRMDLFALLSQLGTSNAITTGLATIPTGVPGVQPGGGTIDTGLLFLPGSSLNYTPAGPVFPTTFSCSSASPCSIMGVDRDLRNPSVITWTLGVQHAFTNNLTVEAAYVGNHGRNLLGIRDLNQPPVGAGYGPGCMAPPANPACEAAAAPFATKFPFLGFINFMSNQDESNYNALQVSATARTFHGLSFVAGYTYSHAVDDASNDTFAPQAQDSTHPGLEYGNSDYDIRHRFTFSMNYALPGIKSFGQLLQGWNVTSIVTLQGGQPWYTADFGDDISGTGELNDRWDYFGNPADFTSGPNPIPFFGGTSGPACAAKALALDGGTRGPFTAALGALGCYAKGNSVMIPPAFGTFGTLGRNVFRASGFYNWDASIFKDFKFAERVTAQFRAEFFNVLNHPLFANPYGGTNGFALNDASFLGPPFGCGCATPDVAGSNPVLGSGGNRAIQFGLKLIF